MHKLLLPLNGRLTLGHINRAHTANRRGRAGVSNCRQNNKTRRSGRVSQIYIAMKGGLFAGMKCFPIAAGFSVNICRCGFGFTLIPGIF